MLTRDIRYNNNLHLTESIVSQSTMVSCGKSVAIPHFPIVYILFAVILLGISVAILLFFDHGLVSASNTTTRLQIMTPNTTCEPTTLPTLFPTSQPSSQPLSRPTARPSGYTLNCPKGTYHSESNGTCVLASSGQYVNSTGSTGPVTCSTSTRRGAATCLAASGTSFINSLLFCNTAVESITNATVSLQG